jgi:hypothetical protein
MKRPLSLLRGLSYYKTQVNRGLSLADFHFFCLYPAIKQSLYYPSLERLLAGKAPQILFAPISE